MIVRETFVSIADATGVKFMKAFHLYGGFKRTKTSLGYYIKGSVRITKKKPKNPYLGKKFFKKGNVIRTLLVRQAYAIQRVDSSTLRFKENSSLVFKKKNTFYSRHTVGPAPYEIRKKRFILAFDEQI